METPTILLVLSCLMYASFSHAYKIVYENSMHGPYKENEGTLVYWDLTGSAQAGDSYIRLTADQPFKQGAIWNNFPSLQNNWEFQVHFQIHGKGIHLSGDGMALWYVRDPLQLGPVFGSKDYFSGLGIFIDTFENKEKKEGPQQHFPYISAMVNNGMYHYENSEDGVMTQVGGCPIPVRNPEVPTKIAVSYMNTNLAVYLDTEGKNQWHLCFKTPGVYLPSGYSFGISASTSEHSDNHDVISASTFNLDSVDMELDNTDIIPMVENFIIPQKYHAEFTDAEEEKMEHKREVKTESEREDDEQVLAEEVTEESQIKEQKIEIPTEPHKSTSDPQSIPHSTKSSRPENIPHASRSPPLESIPHSSSSPPPESIPHSTRSPPPESIPHSTRSPPPESIPNQETSSIPTGSLKYIIYGAAATITAFILLSIIKKYNKRRRDKMHKLL